MSLAIFECALHCGVSFVNRRSLCNCELNGNLFWNREIQKRASPFAESGCELEAVL
jgi:hypothetical protein